MNALNKLDEAADKYLDTQDIAEMFCGDYEGWQIVDAFKAGAEWQKKRFEAEYELDWITDLKKDLYELGRKYEREQMMKDAVEGYVTLTLTGAPTVAATIKEGDNIGIGDKVRIIIVKEENK